MTLMKRSMMMLCYVAAMMIFAFGLLQFHNGLLYAHVFSQAGIGQL
jgi:hypothetical protein